MNLLFFRRAAKARRTLEMFEYNCSHILCSPLKSIQGLLTLLETETDPDQITACFNMIIQSTSRLEVIIKELNQAVAGTEGEVVVSRINFNDIVQGVLNGFAQRLESKLIHVTLKIEQSEPFYSDATRLATVLTHLICNAIVFSDDHKPLKTLAIHVGVTKSKCILTVTDNGCGMPAEIQDKIFQPFYRGSEKATGPGLGLFIVAEIIHKIGAKLTVDSHAGKGSAFSLTLPSLRN